MPLDIFTTLQAGFMFIPGKCVSEPSLLNHIGPQMNILSDLTSSLGELTISMIWIMELLLENKILIYFGNHFLICFFLHLPLLLLWHLFQGSQIATKWTTPPHETPCWILQCIAEVGVMWNWQRRSLRAGCWESSSGECDLWLNWKMLGQLENAHPLLSLGCTFYPVFP